MTALQGFFQKRAMSIKAVTTNKRAVVVSPVLTLNSTKGKFKLSGACTKVMGISSGDFVTLANNEAMFEELWGTEEGVVELTNYLASEECIETLGKTWDDVNDPEFRAAFEKAYLTWFVAKGYPLFTEDGKPIMTVDRAEKTEIQKCAGSRCASKSDLDGSAVDFQDTGSWTLLKSDLVVKGEDEIMVREYQIDLENPVTSVVFDGANEVEVKFYKIKLDTVSDKPAQERKKAEDKSTEAVITESEDTAVNPEIPEIPAENEVEE